MPFRFAVHVATTGKEVGRYRTQRGAEASALRLSTEEVYLEVWWVDDKGKRGTVISRFAYGRTMPIDGLDEG